MLSLCSNLRPPFQSLVISRQNISPSCLPINRVKFNLNKGFIKISTTIQGKKASVRSTKGVTNGGKMRRTDKVVNHGDEKWIHEGLITESLPNGMFKVRLDNQDMVLGHISGRIRRNFIRILPGDRVQVEVGRYDSTRGRIIYRIQK